MSQGHDMYNEGEYGQLLRYVFVKKKFFLRQQRKQSEREF